VETLCAGKCVDTSSNNSHCGACDNACTPPDICLSGICQIDTAGHLDVRAGGYVVAPYTVWQGYAWTSAAGSGSTITPADYSNVITATQLCASGSVGASPDSSGSALIGVNLYQPQGSASVGWSTDPNGGGMAINVFNRGGSPLRVELRGVSGQRYCALLPMYGYTVTIPWSAFHTQCDGTGTSWDGTQFGSAIERVVVLVPGSTAAVEFDFCINTLQPVWS
jgi:hypothetical protein